MKAKRKAISSRSQKPKAKRQVSRTRKPSRKPAEPARKAPPAAGQAAPDRPSAKQPWPAKDLAFFRRVLLDMRERLTGQITGLKVDSLTREDAITTEEDGTDAFERQFALSIARLESNSVAEIDAALKRIEDGSYGICEECGCRIGRARLAALPFVRLCITCKSREEQGRPRFLAMENDQDKVGIASSQEADTAAEPGA